MVGIGRGLWWLPGPTQAHRGPPVAALPDADGFQASPGLQRYSCWFSIICPRWAGQKSSNHIFVLQFIAQTTAVTILSVKLYQMFQLL